MKKRILSSMLVLAMLFMLAVPASAAGTGQTVDFAFNGIVSISGEKQTAGRLNVGAFDEQGNLVASGTHLKSGVIDMKTTFTEADLGIHTFTMKITGANRYEGEVGYFVMDSKVFTLKVEVSYNASGELTAKTIWYNAPIVFTNYYYKK